MKKVAVGIVSRLRESGEPEYLLVSSAKDFGEYTGYFYPPGGHVEENETEADTLVREIKEELGLAASIQKLITVTPGDVADQETFWFACEVTGEMSVDPELSAARYFTQAEIMQGKVWPATVKVFKEHVFTGSDHGTI